MSYVSGAVCNDCWELRRPGHRPLRGTPFAVEQHVEIHGSLPVCVYCGQETDSGIFERVRVEDVPFPPAE